MPTNKHAQIRYRALDKCFSNFSRNFFIEDLVEACNQAIYEYAGIREGVRRRQIFDDIAYMESEAGGAVPLQRLKEGRRTFYRYTDPNFSINKLPLNPTELEQLKDTIYMLNRFKGLPQFDWMQEVLTRFESFFHLKGDVSGVVSFAQNPDLVGLNHFTDLFHAIVNRQVLQIIYHRFSKPATCLVFHPYHLKQYNNRWFLIGYNPVVGDKYPVTNLALDRIEALEVLPDVTYQEYKGVDFEDYFYDVVGVSVLLNKPNEKIRLKANYPSASYILTKPLHASQKVKEKASTYVILELNLIPNYEFETLLLGYAHEVEVLEPLSLRAKIRRRAQDITDKNL